MEVVELETLFHASVLPNPMGFNKSLVNSNYCGAGGGGRTLMPSEGRGILSPVRLPVPPLQQIVGYHGVYHCFEAFALWLFFCLSPDPL